MPPKQVRERTNFELLELFYQLRDGTIWNPLDKRAMFESEASARKFKQAAPDWQVFYKKEIEE